MSHSIPLGNQSGEHIRILVIGNANAGKTTVLEKVCHARGIEPDYFDKDGNKIDVESKPSALRGAPNIEESFQYPTARGFIFHDSGGLEAGGADELERVMKFIKERAEREQSKDRLHAIWYCIPTSNDRAMLKAAISLFETGTGNVPVIAIFTKMDTLDERAFNQLVLDEGSSFKEANSKVSSVAKDIFKRNYLQPLKNVAYKPAYIVRLRDMHKAGTDCDELIRRTSWVLDGGTLKSLCLSMLRNNMEPRVKNVASQGSDNKAAQGNGLAPVKVTWRGGGDTVMLASPPYDIEWVDDLEGQVLERHSPTSLEFSAIVHFPPGTHQFRFLVDGKWCLADDLPTAVDDDGILANYLVVPHPINAEDDQVLSGINNAQSSILSFLLFSVAVIAAILAAIPCFY